MYELRDNQEKVKFLREAADVQRLHVIRTIGEYSNGHHSFNMLAMLRLLWPDAPIELIWAVLEHDVPERIIGDTPSPALHHVYMNSAENRSTKEIEVLLEVFDRCYIMELPDELLRWLKGLDLLELYLYAKDQVALGNRNLLAMMDGIEKRFKRDASKFPEEILNLFYECKNSDWSHLPDLGA